MKKRPESLQNSLTEKYGKARLILKEIKKGNNYNKVISNELDTSTNSISNYVGGLVEFGFIQREKNGRKRIYSLTEKAEHFFEMEDRIKEKKEELENLKEKRNSMISH